MSLTYDDLQKLLVLKKDEVLKQGNGELGKVEKLVEEFFKMNVPHGSEILDVASGSGILSCFLQTKGYFNIDALDEDLDVINDLKQIHLYRNYIHSAVKGIRSTGLEANVYDVVITAGGFAKDAINPMDITELIRILRPEGHLLWTMRAAQDERCAEFGLLLANLRSLERAGRIQIIKHQQFIDYDGVEGEKVEGNETTHGGEFYLIKRLPGVLPYFVDTGVSTELKAQIAHILKDATEPENRIRFYDEWSDKYDQDLVLVGNYSGHTKCVEAFMSLQLNRSVNILDLACGTGLLGGEVMKHGYVNMDGLDASLQMLGQARKKSIFKDYIFAQVNGLGSLPLCDDVYDVVMSSNGFAPGQIYPESVEEILRILKPGGYLLLTMRDGLADTSPRFALMENDLRLLEKNQKCEVTLGPVQFENFVLNHPGVFYMIRKNPHLHLAYVDTQP
jgi:ubiquinone/menaquinone biosynthesis C-methylase UbiE